MPVAKNAPSMSPQAASTEAALLVDTAEPRACEKIPPPVFLETMRIEITHPVLHVLLVQSLGEILLLELHVQALYQHPLAVLQKQKYKIVLGRRGFRLKIKKIKNSTWT